MPEKISILKDSGETVSSNVVSVFMIPDTQKRYLISTENTVDPHGLTILHVSEIVDGALQKIATDEEDVMLITDTGTIIRLKVKDISILGRPTQGVTLMRTTDGGKVVSIETLTPEIAEVEECE